MSETKYIAYYRVSTQKQGASGLGLEAQKKAVTNYLKSNDVLISQYTEIETGKGSNALDKREQLRLALNECRLQKASLIIAKLDRLARNVHFISGLLETGVDFVAADMPEANKVMIQMYSVMAEWERDQISVRTKAALSAARDRGIKLGVSGYKNLKPNIETRKKRADAFAAGLYPTLKGYIASGMSQRQIVAQLNKLGVTTINGGTWSRTQLQRVFKILNNSSTAHITPSTKAG